MALKGISEAYVDSDEGEEEEANFSPSPSASAEFNVKDDGGQFRDPASVRSQPSVANTPLFQPEYAEPPEAPRKGFPQNLDLTEEERVRIPDDTNRPVSPHLERKVADLARKCANRNVNHLIQNNKSFRNPSIYQKLIEYVGIDEFGTNFDSTDFDPHRWTDVSTESLLKAQMIATEKAEKEKKAKGGGDVVKRKTKWDSEPARKVIAGVKVPFGQPISTSNLTKSTK